MLELYLHPLIRLYSINLNILYLPLCQYVPCSDVYSTAFSVVSNQSPVIHWRNIHFPFPCFHSILRCGNNCFRYLLLLEFLKHDRKDRNSIASIIQFDSQGIDNDVTNPKKTRQLKFSAKMHSSRVHKFSKWIIRNFKRSLQRKRSTSYGGHVCVFLT